MKKYFTLKDLDVTNKRILVRVDFNVPLNDCGDITNDKRIHAALPTLQYLIEHQAKLIVCSHLGRPKGKVVDHLRMNNVADRLGELLNTSVKKMDDCVGEHVQQTVRAMNPKDVVILENLRFYKEETENDNQFSQQLAGLADYYVNDAFGTMHRAHASTYGVTQYITSAAGLLVETEMTMLSKVIENPDHPFIAILGGSKMTDKLGVIKNILPQVDNILIGGAMMFSFLKAKGLEIGMSKCDDSSVEIAKDYVDTEKIILPVDALMATECSETVLSSVQQVNHLDKDKMGLDIGPASTALFKSYISNAKTVVWSGPMGVFEIDSFSKGTASIAQFLVDSSAITIVGGGDSAAAIDKYGLREGITHVSTGGGASLEFLEGKKLPGIEALELSYAKQTKQ